MESFSAELLVEAGNGVGEGPLWHSRQKVLYWVDITAPAILRRNGDGSMDRWQAPMAISAIVEDLFGNLIGATAEGFAWLVLEGSNVIVRPMDPVLAGRRDMRLNDGACDRVGRFWAGSMRLPPDPAHPVGELFCLDLAGSARPVLDGLLIQNGLAWSPDGSVMYLSDSHRSVATVWAFDYDQETATPRNRRIFYQGLPGRPDGAAMDVDGGYWIAMSDSGRVLRLTPDGKVDAEIAVPVPNPTNICFGGADLRTAFITSMRVKSEAGGEIGGDVYVCDLPFHGMSETRYGMR